MPKTQAEIDARTEELRGRIRDIAERNARAHEDAIQALTELYQRRGYTEAEARAEAEYVMGEE